LRRTISIWRRDCSTQLCFFATAESPRRWHAPMLSGPPTARSWGGGH